MQIDIYTILFTIINFLILYFFLRRKLFTPVTEFLSKRTTSIENQINDASDNFKKSEELKEQYEKRLDDAKIEGKNIVEEYKQRADSVSDDIIGKAKNEAELIRERARRDIERERETARDEIKKQVVDLSILIASKAIKEQLDDEKHHGLIMEFIDKVGI